MLMGVTGRVFTTGAGAKPDDPPIKPMERRDKSFMVVELVWKAYFVPWRRFRGRIFLGADLIPTYKRLLQHVTN